MNLVETSFLIYLFPSHPHSIPNPNIYVSKLNINDTPASVQWLGVNFSVIKVAVKTNVGPLKVV